jgi:hypothetical protein
VGIGFRQTPGHSPDACDLSGGVGMTPPDSASRSRSCHFSDRPGCRLRAGVLLPMSICPFVAIPLRGSPVALEGFRRPAGCGRRSRKRSCQLRVRPRRWNQLQQAAAGAAHVGAAAGAQQVGAAAGAQQVGAAGAQQLVLWQQPSFGSLILQQAFLNPQQALFTRSRQQRTFFGLQQCVFGAQQD